MSIWRDSNYHEGEEVAGVKNGQNLSLKNYSKLNTCWATQNGHNYLKSLAVHIRQFNQLWNLTSIIPWGYWGLWLLECTNEKRQQKIYRERLNGAERNQARWWKRVHFVAMKSIAWLVHVYLICKPKHINFPPIYNVWKVWGKLFYIARSRDTVR